MVWNRTLVLRAAARAGSAPAAAAAPVAPQRQHWTKQWPATTAQSWTCEHVAIPGDLIPIGMYIRLTKQNPVYCSHCSSHA